jgi:hypothetical protein
MAPCERGTGVCPPSRVPLSSFEGAAFRPYRSGWHSATGLTPATPHSATQWRGWPHRGSWRTVPGHDSQVCQGRGVDSSSTWAPANVSALNAPVGGAGAEAASPRGPRARRNLTRGGDCPSSEAEPRSRGCPAPERGGTSPEGGGRPSNEAEVFPCSAAPLERSGVLLEGGWAVCLVGRRATRVVGPVVGL